MNDWNGEPAIINWYTYLNTLMEYLINYKITFILNSLYFI